VLLYELLNLAVSFNGFLSMLTSKNFFNRYSEISFFSLFLKRNRPVLFRKDLENGEARKTGGRKKRGVCVRWMWALRKMRLFSIAEARWLILRRI
jgi:hypothetical protein